MPKPRNWARTWSTPPPLEGLPAVILRPKAIFGPGDRALLPRLVAAARQGRLRRFGDGKNYVDLTYVENVADAVLLAIDAPAAPGHTYFITNGEHVRLWPTIESVLRRLNISSDLKPLPLSLALAAASLMEATGSLHRPRTAAHTLQRRHPGAHPDLRHQRCTHRPWVRPTHFGRRRHRTDITFSVG